MQKYKKCIIAFIDILGFKSLVNLSEKNDKTFGLIESTLESFKMLENKDRWTDDLIIIEEDAQKKNLTLFSLTNKIKCSCFSDSIVISVEVDNNDINEKTSTLIANISRIGADLLCKGVLIRGAITIGNLIHKDNGVIFGNGFIQAYQLESEVSVQPRIILSSELISSLNYPLCSKHDRYPYHQYVDRFMDGCVGFTQLIYFQVLQDSTKLNEKELANGLSKSRETIIIGLDANINNVKIFNKYRWLKDEYDKLIIFNEKKPCIRNVEESESRHNIHYKYINSLDNSSRQL